MDDIANETFGDPPDPVQGDWIDVALLPGFAEGLFSATHRDDGGAGFRLGHAVRRHCSFTGVLSPKMAFVLCLTLWSDESTLWQVLIYLCGVALQGGRVAPVVGPVGAGKSTMVLSFFILLVWVGVEDNVVLLCATNQPLDDLAEQAFDTMDPELCTVVRLCSASWYRTLNEQSSKMN